MICYPWTVNWKAQGQDIEEFKYFKRWFDEMAARPGVQRGMAVGANMSEDQSTLSQAEKDRRAKMLYNQRARPVPVS
jgi:GST-like protein